MPNLFRHLTDYARSHLSFSAIEKPLNGFSSFKSFGRDCFVATLLAMTLFSEFLTPSAFAADDEMTVSVPEYVELIKGTKYSTSSVNIENSGSVKLDNRFEVYFSCKTNTAPNLYLSVTAPVTGGRSVNAWNAKNINLDGAGKIIFTRNDNSATENDVLNALSDNPVPENNKNAIGFPGWWWWDGNTFQVESSTNNIARITVNKSSIGNFSVGHSGNYRYSLPNTFSPHDSAGVYTATVHITTIAP